MEDGALLENIRARGEQLRAGIAALAKKFPLIREVRGEGLMLGIELSVEGGPFVTEALRRGLLINCTHDHTLRLLPPYIVSAAQVREFLRLFEAVLAHTPQSSLPCPSSAATAERTPAWPRPRRGEHELHPHFRHPCYFPMTCSRERNGIPRAGADCSISRPISRRGPDVMPPRGSGSFLAMIFEKPSLRTRVTFEVGMTSMGGYAIYPRPCRSRAWASARPSRTWRATSSAGCTASWRAFAHRRP